MIVLWKLLNISRYQDPFIDIDQAEKQIEHSTLRILEQFKSTPVLYTA